jgi:hypothetical protein
MDEISKIGDINSMNDLFDFKISIKTIMILVFLWGFGCVVIIVFLLGGINNTVDYMVALIESIKTFLNKKREASIPPSKPNNSDPKEKKETPD